MSPLRHRWSFIVDEKLVKRHGEAAHIDRYRRALIKRSEIRHTMQDDILESFSFDKHWLHIVLATCVGTVVLVGLLVYVIIKRRRKAAGPLTPDSPKQPTLVQCPPVAINYSSTAQQPSLQHFGSHPPVRIRTKGLLERRGSSASLTIDLNPSESSACGTPPKECSAEEYLTSAGNRMTRRQLRACIKNPKIIHQEFLEVPLNHPGKPSLVGWSSKNRYQSIWPNEWSRVVLRKTSELRSSSSPAIPHPPSSSSSRSGAVDQPPPYDDLSLVDTDDDAFIAASAATDATTSADAVVTPSTSSSYINANYIRGYDGEPRTFIATQGPLGTTVDDFWRMVWQERAPCIVMMTKLKEKNRTKCEPYLPKKEGRYGEITIQIRSTVPKNGYIVRDLILKKDDGRWHPLKHYWFTGWPDHRGAPMTNARHLLEMATDVLNCRRRQSADSLGRPPPSSRRHSAPPVIVHCSAGLGRTGCFIAICIGMRQLQEENMVDGLGIVCQMRIDRGGMVQNPEQYEFIHQVLAVYERQLPETPTSAALAITSSSSSSSPLDPDKPHKPSR